jgi:putative chitinase
MLCSPASLPDSLMDDLSKAVDAFKIDRLSLAYFLGQCGEESGGLRYPVEIASGSAYEGRKDLGNTHPGDGVKFAGTGWIQVTGRHNHQGFSDYLTSIGKHDPKIMEIGKTYTSEVYPWSISAFWWWNNGMISFCHSKPDVDRVGQRVNGCYPPRGAAERRAYTQRAFKELGE